MITPENKQREREVDLDFIFFIIISILFGMSLCHQAFAKEVCPIRLDDKSVAKVPITLRGTVLSFPVKPTKVILGRSGSFGIEYVENDLAISPLSPNARSNLFTYLLGRRFTFDLFVNPASGCTVVPVRDSLEVQTRIDFGGK